MKGKRREHRRGKEEAKGGIVPDLVPCRPTEPGDNRQSQSGLLQIAARMRDKARMKGWKLRLLKEGRVPRGARIWRMRLAAQQALQAHPKWK